MPHSPLAGVRTHDGFRQWNDGDAAMTSNHKTSDGQEKGRPKTPDLKDVEPGSDADAVDATDAPAHESTSIAEQVDNGKVPDPPGIP